MIRTVILALFGGMLLLMSLRSLRAHRLQERYVLLFIATGLPFIILAAWPDGIVLVSTTLGIERHTIQDFTLGAFSILLFLKLFSIISVQQRRIAELAQHVAILREEQSRQSNLPESLSRTTDR